MDRPCWRRGDTARLLRAARFRHPSHLLLIGGGSAGPTDYLTYGPHARIVHAVGLERPPLPGRLDWVGVRGADVGIVVRRLLAAGHRVAVYDADTPAHSIERVALQEFPLRRFLEPPGEYADRVAEWVGEYLRPALAFHPHPAAESPESR